MPQACPKGFREDVIRVYRDCDASMAQVAKDFGISPVAPEAVTVDRQAEVGRTLERSTSLP